jgi:hypothetical protein
MTWRLCLITLSILCLATALLWCRSIRTADELTLLTHADTQYTLATHPHGIDFTVTTNARSHPLTWNPISPDGFPKEGWSRSTHSWDTLITREGAVSLPHAGYRNVFIDFDYSGSVYHWRSPERSVLGLGYQTSSESWTSFKGTPITRRTTVVVVPFWLLMVLLMLPWAGQAARFAIRRRRIRANRCVSCGYDLRATSGNCPECGTPRPLGQSRGGRNASFT